MKLFFILMVANCVARMTHAQLLFDYSNQLVTMEIKNPVESKLKFLHFSADSFQSYHVQFMINILLYTLTYPWLKSGFSVGSYINEERVICYQLEFGKLLPTL